MNKYLHNQTLDNIILKNIITENYKIIPIGEKHWHDSHSKKILNICLIKKEVIVGYDSDAVSRDCLSCGKNILEGSHTRI